jgi:hypothetical protein
MCSLCCVSARVLVGVLLLVLQLLLGCSGGARLVDLSLQRLCHAQRGVIVRLFRVLLVALGPTLGRAAGALLCATAERIAEACAAALRAAAGRRAAVRMRITLALGKWRSGAGNGRRECCGVCMSICVGVCGGAACALLVCGGGHCGSRLVENIDGVAIRVVTVASAAATSPSGVTSTGTRFALRYSHLAGVSLLLIRCWR